jgi:hypothetical protein
MKASILFFAASVFAMDLFANPFAFWGDGSSESEIPWSAQALIIIWIVWLVIWAWKRKK